VTDARPRRHHQKLFATTDDLLDFAIEKEAQAATFYESLAERATSPIMRMHLLDFAAEERRHREKLLGFRLSRIPLLPSGNPLETLGVTRRLQPITVDEDLTMKDALHLAMREEKAAFALYFRLAGVTEDKTVRLALMAMAEEEAKHKLHFELAYDALLFEQ